MSKEIYQIITDQIISKLEQGVIPWHKPWRGYHNGVTKKDYRGLNVLLLSAADYKALDFYSFKQISDLGGTVKPGEHGHMITFWKPFKVEDPNGTLDPETGKRIKMIPLLRYYRVWNREQCNGLPEAATITATAIDPIEAAEQIVAEYVNGPAVIHDQPQAFYNPNRDFVNMPKKEAFTGGAEEYYSTLFHELTHSTGHPSRLNRLAKCNYHFNDDRSREELTAELGAAFLCGKSGIIQRTIDNSAAYIQSWLAVLKNDSKFIIDAASSAQKAVDFILGETIEPEEITTPARKRKSKRGGIIGIEQLTFAF